MLGRSAGVAHGLGEGQGESGQAHEHKGESHGAPLLAPPPPPPLPPLMTHAEIMAGYWLLAESQPVPWR